VPQSKDLRLHLSLLPVFSTPSNKPVISTEAAHSFIVGRVVEKSASPPHLFSSPQSAFAVAVACFSPHHQKTVISTEAAHGLTVSRAVEKSAFFVLIAAFTRTNVLHQDAHNLPNVTILSMVKLVKTPVSRSSQT